MPSVWEGEKKAQYYPSYILLTLSPERVLPMIFAYVSSMERTVRFGKFSKRSFACTIEFVTTTGNPASMSFCSAVDPFEGLKTACVAASVTDFAPLSMVSFSISQNVTFYFPIKTKNSLLRLWVFLF